MIEVAGQPTDDCFIACIRHAKSAASQAAKVLVGADDDYGFTKLFGLNGSNRSRGSTAIDDHIISRLDCESRRCTSC